MAMPCAIICPAPPVLPLPVWLRPVSVTCNLMLTRLLGRPQDQDAQRSTALKWYMGAPSGLSLYTSQSEEFTGRQSEVFDGFPFGNFPTSSSAQACMPQHQQQEANTWDDVCSDVAGGYKHVLYTGGAPPPNVYHNMDSGGPSTLMHHTSRPFL